MASPSMLFKLTMAPVGSGLKTGPIGMPTRRSMRTWRGERLQEVRWEPVRGFNWRCIRQCGSRCCDRRRSRPSGRCGFLERAKLRAQGAKSSGATTTLTCSVCTLRVNQIPAQAQTAPTRRARWANPQPPPPPPPPTYRVKSPSASAAIARERIVTGSTLIGAQPASAPRRTSGLKGRLTSRIRGMRAT